MAYSDMVMMTVVRPKMKQIGIGMRLKTTIDVFDYWNLIRGADAAPLRSAIEPTHIGHFLSSLFMLEAHESGTIFRLAGSRICDLFGRDLGGSQFSQLWPHGHQDIEMTALGVMQHAMPALLNVTGYSAAGHSAAFEIILLPLRSNESECDRLLGAIASSVAASWLEIVPLEFFALDRSRLLHEQFGPQSDAVNQEPTAVAAGQRPPSISETLRSFATDASRMFHFNTTNTHRSGLS